MRIPVDVPNLGFDTERAKLGSWLKQVGEPVTKGEPIVEIETEKAMVEMESLESGTLIEILHGAGDEVAVGETIAYLDDGN